MISLLIGVSIYGVAERMAVPRNALPQRQSDLKRKPSISTHVAGSAAATQQPMKQPRPAAAPLPQRAEQPTQTAPARQAAAANAAPDPAAAIVPGSGAALSRSLGEWPALPDCPQMVVVPAGAFTMGSWVGEQGHDADESPSHPVTIKKPFALGRFAVTRGEFAAFVKATGYRGARGCYAWNLADWTPKACLVLALARLSRRTIASRWCA